MSALEEDEGALHWSGPSMTNITNSTPYEEDDVKWCYVLKKPDVCVRIAVMLTLTTITGIILLLRVIQYHIHRSLNYSHYLTYYAGLLLIVLSEIHWSYVSSAIIDFFTTFLVVFQLLVIAHFVCFWAARILERENLYKYIVGPVLFFFLVYFISVTLWAILTLKKDTHECSQPQWLLFSTSQLILVQLFLLAVVYITRKVNTVLTARGNRISQKAQLWGLTVVYELATVVTFFYDLALLITKSKDRDCQTFFTSNNCGIVAIYILHGAVKYLLPQWGISILLSPMKRRPSQEDIDSSSWAGKPNYQTFDRTNSDDSDESKETEYLIPYSISHARYSSSSLSSYAGVLPRTSSSSIHSSYFSGPWLKTRPGQTFPTQQALHVQT